MKIFYDTMEIFILECVVELNWLVRNNWRSVEIQEILNLHSTFKIWNNAITVERKVGHKLML